MSSSKRGAPALVGSAQLPPRSGSGSPLPRGGPSPSPAAATGATTLPSLGSPAAATASKRFDWIEGSVGEDGGIKARRPASRTDSRGRAGSPEFWTRSVAASLVESSVKNPELKLQLLTRALEESRGKIQHLLHDRGALADALLQLCMSAGAGEEAEAGLQAAAREDEDAVLPLRLDLLSTQLQQLKQALQVREVAVSEAQMQHERAALQVVAQHQKREVLEQQLEEARYSTQQNEQAQHAMKLKISLLEEQLAATADSARRHMEEQLNTFRGDVVTARTMSTKFADLERQLDAAHRTQHAEAEHCRQLTARLERVQGRLKETAAKQADLSQRLWDKSAAHNEVCEQHRTLQEDSKSLAAENSQLQAALAASQQRARQAADLGAGLQAQCQAGQQVQEALQEEVERLRAELQQEREQKHRLQAGLAEEQVAGAHQRAALQGKQDEISSLLLKLDEYANRIVAAEGALEAASRQGAQEAARRKQAEAAAQQARHENGSLRDSLADLAATEAKWKQQLGQAEGQLAEAVAAQAAQQGKCRQMERAAATAREHVQLLQATLAEQRLQLERMGELEQQCGSQQQQLSDLKEDLHAAAARDKAAQAAADDQAAAKQLSECELRKQQVLAQHLQEQSSQLAAQLKATSRELEAVKAEMEAVGALAAWEREEHAADKAAQQQAHEQRKARNEHLEHDNKQQAIIIAELQATCTSHAARLASTQQHNAVLHRYAVANGAAYGRLSAHAGHLHQQFARQLGGLLQMCCHLGLQLAAALSAADPVPALEAGRANGSNSPAALDTSAMVATSDVSTAQSAVAAAVLSIESVRVELQVAVQLLEMQAGSNAAQQLAAVPAGIAEALAADLAGLPAALLMSPRLAPAGVAALAAAATGRGGAALGTSLVGGSSSSAGASTPAASTAAGTQQQSNATAWQQQFGAAAPPLPSSALSAQVSQMETHLERLLHGSSEQAARAAAAVQLHEQERTARQRAADLAADLSAQLAAVQTDLLSTREQRDQLEAQRRQLAKELRDAIYSISQMHAQQQGQAVSWAVRGLRSAAIQTQYCELWEANLAGSGRGSGGSGGAGGCMASDSGDGSVLCAVRSSGRSSSSGRGSEDGGAIAAAAASATSSSVQTSASTACQDMEPGPAGRVLPLPALQQQIKEIYSGKAMYDLAVARGQRPFLPLSDFLAAHLAQQHGSDGQAVQQRAQQLQASVEAHAGVFEVGMFGLAASMLEEASSADAAPEAAGQAALIAPGNACTRGSGSSSTAAAAAAAAAAAVPLVLYHSRRQGGSAAAQQQEGAVPALRRFCAASWHAAHQLSAARQPLPQPFNPAGPELPLLHPMSSEVHNLAMGVPGVEQLMCWVLGGGLGGCLPQLDLGLRLAENQVPQLYLLAAESCRLLGMATTPQLYVKNSSEAAAYYLLLPGEARLHGLNGGLAQPEPRAAEAAAEAGAAAAGRASSSSSSRSSNFGVVLQASSVGHNVSNSSAVLAAESQDWQCALVLTSSLVDLLEPRELQAVMAGCLGFHAALMPPAGACQAGGASREGAQLAVLCRSMAALATLGALCALSPDTLTQRLPHQMAPFFYSRMQPVLRRALRYLSLFCDRVAAGVVGSWRPVAAAVVKQAAGSAVLRNELNLEAVMQQARALDDAATDLLPKALLHEEPAVVAGAGSSLALLRIRELQQWWQRR